MGENVKNNLRNKKLNPGPSDNHCKYYGVHLLNFISVLMLATNYRAFKDHQAPCQALNICFLI